jgi:hypothetical protein
VLGIGTKAVGGLVGHGRVHERVVQPAGRRRAQAATAWGVWRTRVRGGVGPRIISVQVDDQIRVGLRDMLGMHLCRRHIRLAPTTSTVQVCAADQLDCRLAGLFDRNLNA